VKPCRFICCDDNDVCFVFVQISCNDNANTEPGRCNTLGRNSADVTLDSQEISETLDEFNRLLSDYSCDDAVPTLSPVQTRLESLFVPPHDLSDLSTCASGRETTARSAAAIGSAAKDNPGPSAAAAEDEASIRYECKLC